MTPISITQPDVTLLMDFDGVIRNASFSATLAEASGDDLVGRAWGDTVVGAGHDAVRRMIADAQASGVSAFSQIVQRLPSGREIPVEYTTLMLGAKAGFIAIGKSLQAVADLQSKLVAAQQAMERDYWKLREIETRYRLLFEASTEAVLLIRDANLRISEANPAAINALGLESTESLTGKELMSCLPEAARAVITPLIEQARAHGRAPATSAQLGTDNRHWLIRTSLVMSEPGPVYLIQLAPVARPRNAAAGPPPTAVPSRLLDRLPDGLAIVDRQGRIQQANPAFLDLVEASTLGAVAGQRVSQWLIQPGADWHVLSEAIARHRLVRLFATTVTGDLGGERKVEISAAGDSDSNPGAIVLLLRDVERRLASPGPTDKPTGMAVHPEDLVGARTLKAVIDDAVAEIERQCIIAALRKCEGNRRAAADMLGLSRQTLYTKLGKYGLEVDPDDLDDRG